jgi:ABC-type glycerol-3-phosphate transport system substrate-binding protein
MATAEELHGIQIRFMHPWAGDVGRELDRLVDEFNQTNEWNVHVIANSTGSQAAVFDQAVQALEAGNPPQVLLVRADQALTLSQQRDALVDLSMYVQDPVFGLDGPQLEDTPPALLDPVRMSGRWIAMPVLASGAVLFYNQAWGRELGFDEPPQTPAEFRTQACAAAEANRTDDTRDNDGTGGWLVDTSAGTVLSWLHGFGGQELTGSGPLTYRFEQPASLQAFQFLRAMLDESCAAGPAAGPL